MSLTSYGGEKDTVGSGAPGALALHGQAPKLRSGAGYSAWRADMEVYLARIGCENAHVYELTSEQWDKLVTTTQAWKNEAMVRALASFGIAATPAASAPAASFTTQLDAGSTAGKLTDEEKTQRAQINRLVELSSRAYGALYSALDGDLRAQVTQSGDVPQNFAFGLWKWLERKFQSTEEDSVDLLLDQWNRLEQEEGESFDAYRARVNHLDTLLKHADEKQSARMYNNRLLRWLRPEYRPVVQAIKLSGLLKDPAKVQWDIVTAEINAHERDLARTSGAGSGAVAAAAMAAAAGSSFTKGGGGGGAADKRSTSQWRTTGGDGRNRKSSKERGRDPRTCFRCNQRGHILVNCPASASSLSQGHSNAQGQSGQPRQGAAAGERVASAMRVGAAAAAASTSDQLSKRTRFSDLTGTDDDEETPSSTRGERASALLVGCGTSYLGATQRGIARQTQRVSSAQVVATQSDTRSVAHTVAVATSNTKVPTLRHSVTNEPQSHLKTHSSLPAGQSAKGQSRKIKASPVQHKISIAEKLTQDAWGFDTMASAACSGNRRVFTSMRNCPAVPVQVADGGVVNVTKIGSVELRLRDVHGDIVRISIKDVLYHEQFASNLLSGELLRQKYNWEYHGVGDGSYVVTPGGHCITLSTQGRVAVLLDAGEERAFRALTPGAGKSTRVHDDQEDRLVLLHQRLGHMGWTRLIGLVRADLVVDHGIDLKLMTEANLRSAEKRVRECLGCTKGKTTRIPFGRRGLHCGTRSGEVLHMDLYEVKVVRDGRPVKEYGLLVVDMFSDMLWHAHLQSKDQAANSAIRIIRRAAMQFGAPVKQLQCDGGGEFINQTLMARFCDAEGIAVHWTPARTPQLNGAAERSVRTVKEYRCAVMHHAGAANNRFWHHAVDHAIYVWNRTHGSTLTEKTPYEVIHGRTASVRHVAVWGCDAFCHIPKVQRGPLDTKAQPCIYLGHDEHQNAARVLLLETNKVIVSRDIKYRNDRFAHLHAAQRGEEALRDMLDKYAEGVEPHEVEWIELDVQQEEQLQPQGAHAAPVQGGLSNSAAEAVDAPSSGGSSRGDHPGAAADECIESEDDREWDVERILGRRRMNGKVQYKVRWAGYDASEDSWEPEENLDECAALDAWQQQQSREVQPHAPSTSTATAERRSTRNHASSRALAASNNTAGSIAAGSDGDAEPDEARLSSAMMSMAMSALRELNLPDDERTVEQFMSAITASAAALEELTPTTYKEAMAGPHREQWMAALQQEMKACEEQQVWKLVRRDELPHGTNVLPCKVVFKIKTNEDGSIDKFKARFTPKGFRQKANVDFFETFARTAMYKTLRVALSLVAKWDHELAQFDVPTAFLYAPVEEDVYMELPEGFGQPGMVCKLLKSLYGLKQAPRNWDKMIHSFITTEMGWKALVSDASFYFKRSRSGRVMLIYRFVDDMQGSYHAADVDEFKESVALLQQRFNIKQLRQESWMLGMRIRRDRKLRTITLDQEQYVTKALEKFGLKECKVASTPEAVGAADDRPGDPTLERPTDRQRYMEIVGTLMYAAISTRPDIAHAVHYLASHMQAPTHRHALAAERVLRYLAGTKSVGLVFGKHNGDSAGDSRGRGAQVQVDVCAFSDADWANNKRDRKSVTGWVAKINGDPVSWSSKKQRVVALSTCEAELYAEAAAIQEVLWLRGLMKELGLHMSTGSVVYGDNQSTIAASSNGVKSERTKHVDVKYHFITETVENGHVKLKWVPTQQQQADIFTKPLQPQVFLHLRGLIMSQ